MRPALALLLGLALFGQARAQEHFLAKADPLMRAENRAALQMEPAQEERLIAALNAAITKAETGWQEVDRSEANERDELARVANVRRRKIQILENFKLEVERAVQTILDPPRRKMYVVLVLADIVPSAGFEVIRNERAQRVLKFTKEQTERIERITKEMRTQLSQIPSSPEASDVELARHRRKIQEITKASRRRVVTVLSEEQQFLLDRAFELAGSRNK